MEAREHKEEIDRIVAMSYEYEKVLNRLMKHKEAFYIILLRRGIVVKNSDAQEVYKMYLDWLHDNIMEMYKHKKYVDEARRLERALDELERMINSDVVDGTAVSRMLSDIEYSILIFDFMRALHETLSCFIKLFTKDITPAKSSMEN